MKGAETKFMKFLEGSNKRFVIPVYQRNYDWKIENCKQLYDDLVKVIRMKRKSHFFGSVVSVYNHEGQSEEFLVIDGQQRLTTVSLLLLAMYNLLCKGDVVSSSSNLKQRILEEYLVDKWQPEDTRIKLKPIKNDQIAFTRLFEEDSEQIRESNVTVNYKYFCDRIPKNEISIDELFAAICSLEIINIHLAPEDNPQLIFESLNSTGLDLTEGDKIRNYILMGLPNKEQVSYYENYWNKIEIASKFDVSAYVRDFLSVKLQSIPSQKKLYSTFKDYVETMEFSTEALLKEMLAYAKRYAILLGEKTKSAVLNACIFRLNKLETTVTRPFFLEVLRLWDEKKLMLAEVTEVFEITENYIFRRMICDLPSNALNKIFSLLHKELIRYDSSEENYVEKLKYCLSSKRERARFPEDSEFAQSFSTRPIYLMQNKSKVYLLERIENAGTKEDKDIYRHFEDGEYSIEHIMPQQLTPSWIKALGENYEEIHEQWLHRIANLSLTAYNAKYSNSSFVEKRDMKNGFAESGIRMNTWIAKKEKWTLEELKERDLYLTKKALEIWSLPSTSYVPLKKEMEYYSLEEEPNFFKGRYIQKFVFMNIEQFVDSWTDMYQKVLETLCEEDSSILLKLAASEDEGLAKHFSFREDDFSLKFVIDGGIYVWSNTNTRSKLSNLTKILNLYQKDLNDLIFFLYPEKEFEDSK